MKHLAQRESFWWFIGLLALSLYLAPLILFGESLYIRIHDNLDITVPILKILAHSGMIFAPSDAVIPNMMGGLPRLSYGSELNYLLWLFVIFEPFTAMAINEMMIHFVAYVSMVVLLRYLLQRGEVFGQNPLESPIVFKLSIIHVCALLFALVPFFPSTGVGVALLPYALVIFLKIRASKDSWFDWAALMVIPFFSSLILVYLFFLFCVGFIVVVDTIRTQRIDFKLLLGMGVMGVIFSFVEYRLVLDLLIGSDFVSHRTEFIRKSVDFMDAYRGACNAFLFGQVHSLNLQFFYVLATIHLALILIWFKNRWSSMASLVVLIIFILSLLSTVWDLLPTFKYYFPILVGVVLVSFWLKHSFRLLTGLLLFTSISCAWYGIWYYEEWIEFSQPSQLLTIFDFSRFVLLLTPVWYVLLALSFVVIVQKLRFGIVVVAVVGILQLGFAFEQGQFFRNPQGLTYDKFVDESLFEQIASHIQEPQSSYRVASVGIHPAVSLYNDFYTLDGYVTNYPLSYKHQFGKIIESNFEHNPNAAHFIENWGSKCYLIAGEYDVDEYVRGGVIDHFYFNSDVFYSMGGRYLLSGYKIGNAVENHLVLQKVFRGEYWDVYLYQIIL